MSRAATSIPDTWELLLASRIMTLRRPSVSHHIALLIEDDLRGAGLLAPAENSQEDDVIGKLQAELKDMKPTDRAAYLAALESFLKTRRRAARGGKTA